MKMTKMMNKDRMTKAKKRVSKKSKRSRISKAARLEMLRKIYEIGRASGLPEISKEEFNRLFKEAATMLGALELL